MSLVGPSETAEAPSGVRLRDLAAFVRSKNAGPFVLTIDIMLADERGYRRLATSGVISPESVAAHLRVPPGEVTVFLVPEAHAMKVTFPRPIPCGDLGDSDIAGGQQVAPLLDIIVP